MSADRSEDTSEVPGRRQGEDTSEERARPAASRSTEIQRRARPAASERGAPDNGAADRSEDTSTIEVRDLHKSFGHVRALDGLDLRVGAGEVHGFLGPNGAGKSTTIRVLLGVLRPTSGLVRLFGRDPWTDAVGLHRRLAYVPGDVTLWPTLSGGETIDLLARMRGGIDQARRAELVERFDLDPRKKARTYSKGNRQKVSLVSAFSSHADLLLLDEPTSGLDPLMEQTFRECVVEAASRGVTVLLSSHILSEVEALCERVTIIRAGHTVESGALADLRHLSRTSITAELTTDPRDLPPLPGAADVHIDDRDDHVVHCQVDAEHLTAVVATLAAAGIRTLVSHPPTLEELFLRHYRVDDVEAAGRHGPEVGVPR